MLSAKWSAVVLLWLVIAPRAGFVDEGAQIQGAWKLVYL